MKYNKLVRDKIPDIILAKGGKVKYRIADYVEYLEKLFEKLNEEMNEFLKSKNEEELADVREVMDAIIDALAGHYKLSKKKVRKIQNKKARERGQFKKRIILQES